MKTEIEKMDAARSGASNASAVEYATFPNAMPASREAAPRLGRAYATGTAGQKEVYECMKELGYQMGEAEAVRVWNASGLILKDRIPKDGRAYDLGFVRFFPALTGTFDSADADFDPKRNRLYVAAAPSDDIRNALENGTPTRTGEQSANDARIDNVTCDETSVSMKNTIRSGEPFDILGSGMTIGKGGESAELVLPGEGGSVPVALTAPEDDKGLAQRLVGRLSQPVDACEGATLSLLTHGFDPAAGLQRVTSSKLTVLAGAPPVPATVTLTSMKTEGMPDNNIRSVTEPITLEGENLTLGEGDRLYMKLTDDPDESYVEVPSTYVKRNTSAEIDLGDDINDPIWSWIGGHCQPTEEHDRITVKLVSHGGVPSSEPQTVTATAIVQFA